MYASNSSFVIGGIGNGVKFGNLGGRELSHRLLTGQEDIEILLRLDATDSGLKQSGDILAVNDDILCARDCLDGGRWRDGGLFLGGHGKSI